MKKFGFILVLTQLSACSTIGWYSQSIGGHLNIMLKQQPIDEVIESPHTSETLKVKLSNVQKVRRYASEKLMLPDNGSFSDYADLGRKSVLWNVVAAPEFSLTPEKWCYPVVGCASYRGYYSRNKANDAIKFLNDKGLDVKTGGVPAYSTLGWFDDPILNTFIDWPLYQISGLIFHELAHQVVYVKNDTTFNESFAHAVELIGLIQWIKENQPDQMDYWLKQQQAREMTFELKKEIRHELETLYTENIEPEEMRARKRAIYNSIKSRFDNLLSVHPEIKPWKYWFHTADNNAWFVASFTYEQHVSAFFQLFINSKQNWKTFYQEVKALARLKPEIREQQLQKLAQAQTHLGELIKLKQKR